jgi:RecQ family ATP-dependent DNA helicase
MYVYIYRWGHDFRGSYRRLNYLRSTYPSVPCMALTATATPQVIKDISSELSLQGCPLHIGSFDRPNIFYKVRYKDALDKPLDDLVKYVTSRHQQKAKNPGELISGIVYVHKRDETTMIANAISKAGVTARAYHAGLKKDERAAVQEGWSNNQIQVAVATVAFGMGIDLAHVRYVIHWCLPKSIEGFYQ